ncbi:DUF2970 domain-containing protein [Pseudoalteromonas sp.]|uniref:DUF2970 domain-containing protein n=1 Tax=Pseudoalteromonas sp. TaxID=53249 RepID=UPI00356996E0
MQYLQSIFAALFGVQSSKKHQDDFQNLSAKHLIILASFLTLALIVAIVVVVNLVIS